MSKHTTTVNNMFNKPFLEKIKLPFYSLLFSTRDAKFGLYDASNNFTLIRVYPEPGKGPISVINDMLKLNNMTRIDKSDYLLPLGAVKAIVFLVKVKNSASSDPNIQWFDYTNLPIRMDRVLLTVMNNVYNQKTMDNLVFAFNQTRISKWGEAG